VEQAGGLGADVVSGDLLVGKDPKVKATEEGGEVCDGTVGVAEVVDPHLAAEGDVVIFGGGGREEREAFRGLEWTQGRK